MSSHLSEIALFIYESFLHIWPYLVITIPIAVAVQMSGAAKHINRAFQARPLVAIVLATAAGAFSPFCSCGVIPVVAALLIGGVPLAPVMAFWVASPSMDPEIFFLSVGALGWQLALWRLGSTLVLSLAAGLVTHLVVQQGWLGDRILRQAYTTEVRSRREVLGAAWQRVRKLVPALRQRLVAAQPLVESGYLSAGFQPAVASPAVATGGGSGSFAANSTEESCGTGEGASCQVRPPSFRQRLLRETWSATAMVVKFMALAFFLEALITLYVPSEWITGLLGPENRWAIPAAAVLGVPVYTSNLAALPMVGGLLAQGMDPAAALAFLIAGPTTTLPAMAAVWGLATRRVFALYVSFSLVGAVLLGAVYSLVA